MYIKKCFFFNYRDIKIKLDLAAVNSSKGAQVRARIKWTEQGEKNTKYFFALEKSRSSMKTITSLSDDSGNNITDVNEIHRSIKDYYMNLYTEKFDFCSKIKASDEFTKDIIIPKLTEREKGKKEAF